MENNKNELSLEKDEKVIVSHQKTASIFKSKKFYLYVGIALAFIIAVIFVCLYINSDKLDKALDIKRNERFQITSTMSFTDLNQQPAEEEYYGDEVYYDENGNIVEDTEELGPTEDVHELGTIKFDGDTVYNSYGEYYTYTRDGERFVLYYYEDILSNFGSNKKGGEWIEVYAENYSNALSFDVDVLYNYKKSDFKKVDDYYVPKEDMQSVFFEVLQIHQTENYADCDIKFYFDNGKLEKIVAEYIYQDSMEVVQTYNFTYNDEKIEVPTADKKYDINDQLIYEKSDKEE